MTYISKQNPSLLKPYVRAIVASLIMLFAMLPSMATAEVQSKSDNGFAIFYIGDVKAQPDEIWSRLLEPSKWWSDTHSWSGHGSNFYLEPKINGCFCELLIDKDADVQKSTGEVEHMRIIHIKDYTVLRMTGALGPLQSEAANGTLTIALRANDDGTTKMSFSYIVGGYMRYKVDQISGAVDKVIGEQFKNLTDQWGLKEVISDEAEDSKISISEDAELLDDSDTQESSKTDDESDGDLDDEDAPEEEVRRER